jgi:exopolysaccharide biosynthesis polyprenyl glycosylphosphotransferase
MEQTSFQPLREPSINTHVFRARETPSRESQWRLFIVSLIVNDVLMIGLAFLLAYTVRFILQIPVFQLGANPWPPYYQSLVQVLVPAWISIFAVNGLYRRCNLLGGIQEYSLVFRAASIGMLLVIVAGFLEPQFILARGWLLLAWLFSFLLVATGRFTLRRVVYALRQHGYFLTPALIIGTNEEARSLAEQLVGWRTSGLHILGFVDNKAIPGMPVFARLPALGKIDDLDDLIREHGVKELILATSSLKRDDIVSIFKRYGLVEGLELRLSSGLFEIITTGLEVKDIAYVPLVRVNKVRLTGLDRILKRALDYSLAIPALIFILPSLLIISLAIKLDSPGPVIYRRRVMGINGKQFDAYKLRTMRVNGDEILAAFPNLEAILSQNHKLREDPRVTTVGKVLRRLSLDELPQLFNVLKGEMSLVGPRIISPSEMAMYEQWAMNLLTVPPGITGLWQVSGRSDISYEERVRLDMYYIRNWTIWLDLYLLFRTVPVVFKGNGAY